MTVRSTRNKMKWQTKKIIDNLEKCQEHFKLLSDLSGGRSTYIESQIPALVYLFDELKGLVKTLRGDL